MITPSELPPIASLIGHQGRCFDLRCLEVGDPSLTDHLLLSSSEDGTARLWNPQTKQCLQVFPHNKSAEVLRSTFIPNNDSFWTLCTGGSDGKAIIWKYSQPSSSSAKPAKLTTLSHRNEESQVYVCESCEQSSNCLLTAADNELLVWDLNSTLQKAQNSWSFYLSNSSANSNNVHFGGEGRNPDGECYVFDAKWHPTASESNIIVSILSDNTMKILDRRVEGIVCTMHFPKQIYDEEISQFLSLGHPTSLNFLANHSSKSEPGLQSMCSVSFGSGHVGLLDLRKMELLSMVKIHSRPCYGSIFSASSNNNHEIEMLSWSSDTTIGKWAYSFQRSHDKPVEQDIKKSTDNGVEILIDEFFNLPSFSPLICCQAPNQSQTIYCGGESRSNSESNQENGGHGKSLSFLGTPIYILNLPTDRTN